MGTKANERESDTNEREMKANEREPDGNEREVSANERETKWEPTAKEIPQHQHAH
jgi:hypothetical protein